MQCVNETAATDRDADDDTAARRLLVFIIHTCDHHLSPLTSLTDRQETALSDRKPGAVASALDLSVLMTADPLMTEQCSEMEWLSAPALTGRKSPPAAG